MGKRQQTDCCDSTQKGKSGRTHAGYVPGYTQDRGGIYRCEGYLSCTFESAGQKIADEEFGGCERIHLIEPLDVVEFHNLMKASYLIMTDSGGIQEEAPALGKPVLVMRDTTERPEGVEAGTLKLAGTKMEDIYRECRRLLTEPEIYRRMSEARNKELPHD